MKKIIIATAIILSLALGVLSIARAQGEWELIDTGFDYILFDISFPEGQSEIGFAVGSTVTYNGDGIILKTTDSGYTWEQISDSDIPGLEAVFFLDLNTGYAAGWDNYLVKTTDGGETWTEIVINSTIWYFVDLEFWDEDNGVAVAAGGQVYVTDDAGETWTTATGISAGIHDLCYASGNVLYAACGDEMILKSIDGGLSWTQLYAGIFTYVFPGVEFFNEEYGMVGGEDGKVLITEDGGVNWSESSTDGFSLWHGFHIFNEDSAYVVGTPEQIYKTTDGGETWENDYTSSSWDAAFYKVIFTPDNHTGFICGSQGIIMRKEGVEEAPAISLSTEEISFPQTWIGETVDFPLMVSNSGTAVLSVTNISSDNTVFYTDMTAFELEPGMEQEVSVTFAPDDEGLFTGTLTIESNDPDEPSMEVSLQGEGLLQTAVISVPDEIAFDTTTVNNTSSMPLVVWNISNADLEVTDIILSGSAFGVDMTNFTVVPGDSTVVTVSFTPDMEGEYAESLEIISNDNGSPTAVILNGYAVLETGILESRNETDDFTAYPNPFDRSVKIQYTAAENATSNLKIYNLFGGLVAELSADHTNGRRSSFSWDGSNLEGKQVNTGIYFGVIEAAGSDKNIKIIKR